MCQYKFHKSGKEKIDSELLIHVCYIFHDDARIIEISHKYRLCCTSFILVKL